MLISYAVINAPQLGDLLLIAEPSQLIGLYFSGCRHAPKISKGWSLQPQQPVIKKAAKQVQEYLAGERTTFSIPLSSKGTAFQEEIWRQIARIPFGQSIAYTELARRAGAPDAIRAAGTATGRNPLSILIPCHRVVAKDGGLGGYAGGIDRKSRLLTLEKEGLPVRGRCP